MKKFAKFLVTVTAIGLVGTGGYFGYNYYLGHKEAVSPVEDNAYRDYSTKVITLGGMYAEVPVVDDGSVKYDSTHFITSDKFDVLFSINDYSGADLSKEYESIYNKQLDKYFLHFNLSGNKSLIFSSKDEKELGMLINYYKDKGKFKVDYIPDVTVDLNSGEFMGNIGMSGNKELDEQIKSMYLEGYNEFFQETSVGTVSQIIQKEINRCTLLFGELTNYLNYGVNHILYFGDTAVFITPVEDYVNNTSVTYYNKITGGI